MEKNKWLGLSMSIVLLISFGSLFFQYQPIPYVTEFINTFVLTHPWTDVFYRILFGSILLVASVSTIFFSFQYVPNKKLRVRTKEGSQEISQKAILSVVTEAVSPILATEKVQIKVKITEKDRLLVKVKGFVQNENFYPYLTEDLQTAIRNDVRKHFAIQDEKIKVVLLTGFNQNRLIPVESSI